MELKNLILIPITLLILNCGHPQDDSPAHLAIHGAATQEERDAVQTVENALIEMGVALPSHPIVFIHDAYKIPPGLGVPWVEFRFAGIAPRDPSVGYGGYVSGTYVYVNRCGSKECHLMSLLIHEISHAVGHDHGSKMAAFEDRVRKHIWEAT